MHIKRFEAPTMAEAVRQVKAELGPEAIVLSTRRLRRDRGLFGLMGKPIVQVTAGVDRQVRRREAPPERGGVETDDSWQGLRAAQALLGPVEAELRDLRRQVERVAVRGDGADVAKQEAAELRQLMRDLAARDAMASGGGSPLLARLVAGGLAARHAASLIGELVSVGDEPSEALLRERLTGRLEARLVLPRPDRDPPVSIFVGAPGVGKTTTLAKLAAREERDAGQVALITTDSFRIGAEEQLRTYAGLLQASFSSAVSPEDAVARARAQRAGRIFIDTAGRGRRDRQAVVELARLREGLGDRSHVHLVVSATTRESALREEVRRFAALRPDSLILTKTDESDHLEDVVNLLLDEEAPPLSWMGNGQRVPEDLVLPEPERLATGVLEAAA